MDNFHRCGAISHFPICTLSSSPPSRICRSSSLFFLCCIIFLCTHRPPFFRLAGDRTVTYGDGGQSNLVFPVYLCPKLPLPEGAKEALVNELNALGGKWEQCCDTVWHLRNTDAEQLSLTYWHSDSGPLVSALTLTDVEPNPKESTLPLSWLYHAHLLTHSDSIGLIQTSEKTTKKTV